MCRTVEPPLVQLASGHWAACHFPERGAGRLIDTSAAVAGTAGWSVGERGGEM